MIVYQLVYWLFPPSGETWFTGKQVEDWPYSVTPALLLVVLKLNDWINDKHKQTVIYLLLMAFKATSSHQWLDRKRCFLEIFRGTSGVCVCFTQCDADRERMVQYVLGARAEDVKWLDLSSETTWFWWKEWNQAEEKNWESLRSLFGSITQSLNKQSNSYLSILYL